MNMENKSTTIICRVCLEFVENKGFFLLESCKNGIICDLINSIANVQIKESDGLPDKICSNCLADLEKAIDFRLKCESSDIVLRSSTFSENAKTEIKCDDYDKFSIKEEKADAEEEFELLDTTLCDTFECNENELSDLFEDSESKPENIIKSKALDLKLICDDCGGSFKSKCKLRVHWKKVHLTEKLECSVCRRAFKSFKAFNRHQKYRGKSCMSVETGNIRVEGHGKARLYLCTQCDYKSKSAIYVRAHVVIHSGERPFKCKMCPLGFTQLGTLHSHQETTHKMYRVELTCQYCGKHLKGRNKAYAHLRTHKSEPAQCDICNKVCKNKKTLEIHMKRHSGVKSFTCEHCAYAFFTSAELANHRRRHHVKDKKYYFCDKCSYKAVNHCVMKKHKAKHTDFNIPCDICGMFFIEASKMLAHQTRHFEEKKNVCQYCDQKFFRRDSLVRHVRIKHDVENFPKIEKPSIKTTQINSATSSNQKIFTIKLSLEENPSGKGSKLLSK